mgnify:CR=1 FL=1
MAVIGLYAKARDAVAKHTKTGILYNCRVLSLCFVFIPSSAPPSSRSKHRPVRLDRRVGASGAAVAAAEAAAVAVAAAAQGASWLLMHFAVVL